jgi:tRNA-dihydrouridine synthase A
MREPALVADCVAAMKGAVSLPVTVKCRIGVDDQDPREALWTLARQVVAAGADALIVHARKAWLSGLSPRENRTVPPLDYAIVRSLKADFTDVPVILNGGLTDIAAMRAELGPLDGVMIGRAAYQNPALLLEVDRAFFAAAPPAADAHAAVMGFFPYVEARLAEGVPLHAMTRHMLGLFNGRPGARAWRRRLSEEGVRPAAGLDVLRRALAEVSPQSEPVAPTAKVA